MKLNSSEIQNANESDTLGMFPTLYRMSLGDWMQYYNVILCFQELVWFSRKCLMFSLACVICMFFLISYLYSLSAHLLGTLDYFLPPEDALVLAGKTFDMIKK